MGSAAHNRAAAKYDAENTVQVRMKLNRKTDEDIIVWLNSQDNRQGYLKALIRADIRRQEQQDEPDTETMLAAYGPVYDEPLHSEFGR